MGQEASVAEPQLEAGPSGRAAGPQTEGRGHAQDPDLHEGANPEDVSGLAHAGASTADAGTDHSCPSSCRPSDWSGAALGAGPDGPRRRREVVRKRQGPPVGPGSCAGEKAATG